MHGTFQVGYPRRESNPHCAVFEAALSAGWSTRATSRSPPRDSNSDRAGSKPAASAVGLGGEVGIGARGEIRTRTFNALDVAPLPIGVRAHGCGVWGSNPASPACRAGYFTSCVTPLFWVILSRGLGWASGSRTRPFRLSGEKGPPDHHAQSAPMESNHPRPHIRRPGTTGAQCGETRWGEAGNRTPLPGSQPAMLTKATSRSEPWESNPACPGPKPGGAPCT